MRPLCKKCGCVAGSGELAGRGQGARPSRSSQARHVLRCGHRKMMMMFATEDVSAKSKMAWLIYS